MALWLCGPPGVGKSAVGWEVRARLPRAAFVDIDQLAMCYPERPGDPGRYRLQARNLAALWGNFRDAGAEVMVVVGSRQDLARCAEVVPVIPLRLHASAGTLAESMGSDPSFDTDGLMPTEITRMILDRVFGEMGQWAAVVPGIAGGWHEQVRPRDPREH